MGAHLVTGYAGNEHITAADQGLYNAGIVGTGKYVLPVGNMFKAVIETNNLIKIRDGCLVNQGRNINIAVNDYEECEIDNGIQALKRNDLIVIRYEKNADTGIESASTVVIKGVSGETAVDPSYTTGNIFNGDTVDDFPLYRVKLDGLNITEVEPLFNTIVSLKGLIDTVTGNYYTKTQVANLFTQHKGSSDHDSRYYTKTEIDTVTKNDYSSSYLDISFLVKNGIKTMRCSGTVKAKMTGGKEYTQFTAIPSIYVPTYYSVGVYADVFQDTNSDNSVFVKIGLDGKVTLKFKNDIAAEASVNFAVMYI